MSNMEREMLKTHQFCRQQSTVFIIKMTEHHTLIPSIIKSTRSVFSFSFCSFVYSRVSILSVCLVGVGNFVSSTFFQRKQDRSRMLKSGTDQQWRKTLGHQFSVGWAVSWLCGCNSNRNETLFVVSFFQQFAHLHTVTCHSLSLSLLLYSPLIKSSYFSFIYFFALLFFFQQLQCWCSARTIHVSLFVCRQLYYMYWAYCAQYIVLHNEVKNISEQQGEQE